MPCRGSSASVEIKSKYKPPDNCKYQVTESKGKVLHTNLFDRTETEYYTNDRGNFDVFFDKKWF